MKFKKKCGIYRIYCKNNRQCYVGSSVWISNRWWHHRSSLKANKHFSSCLQNTWNKYGKSAFTFKILEECPEEALAEREQFWIDKLQPKFNALNIIYPRKKCSVETKAKMAAARQKTHCKRGHALTNENLYIWNNTRHCKICILTNQQTKDRAAGIRTRAEANAARKQTHCKRGHELIDGNLYWTTAGNRGCIACRKLRYQTKARAAGVPTRAEYDANRSPRYAARGTKVRDEMLALRDTGNYTLQQIGDLFGLSSGAVYYQTESRARHYKKSKQATARRLKKESS